VRQERSGSIQEQHELEIVLANFRKADIYEHPKNRMIADMQNKFDRANIKKGEAAHLITMYQPIIYMDRQIMQLGPAVEKEREVIVQQAHDIKELELISRDSCFASLTAVNEYRSTKEEISNAKKECNRILERRRMIGMQGRRYQKAVRPLGGIAAVNKSAAVGPSQ
jgi:hypothetical protein